MAARARKTMDNQIKQNKIIINGDQVVGLFARRRTGEKPWTRIGVIDPRPFSQLQTPGHTYVEQSFNLQKWRGPLQLGCIKILIWRLLARNPIEFHWENLEQNPLVTYYILHRLKWKGATPVSSLTLALFQSMSNANVCPDRKLLSVSAHTIGCLSSSSDTIKNRRVFPFRF